MGSTTEQEAHVKVGRNSPASDSNCKRDDLNSFEFTDEIIAQQFFSLAFNDRNAINEEIHGVRTMAVEETSKLIEDSLMMLAKELDTLPAHYKDIYLKACRIGSDASKKLSGESDEELSTDAGAEDEVTFDDAFSDQEIHPSSAHFDPNSSCYAKSQNFQLAFLRCELFDAKKAALRLTKYLELAEMCFGEAALRRPLRIDDFKSKEEIDVLNAGYQQLLPFRDRSGRRVLAIHGNLSLPKTHLMARSILSPGSAMKLSLYMWSILLEDVDVQRKGLVVVYWPRYVDPDKVIESSDSEEPSDSLPKRKKKRKRGRPRKFKHSGIIDDNIGFGPDFVPDQESRSMGAQFFDAIPVRICALHFCLPDTPFLRMVRHIFQFIIGENFRTRIKTHNGTGMEVMYSLMGYGIPVDTLPMDEVTHKIKKKSQIAFVKVRTRIEAEQYDLSINSGSSSSSSEGSTCSEISTRSCMIECPSLNDVIFRSGKSYMSHPGNMMFRELIEQHIDEHNNANQDRKKNLTWQVIGEVELKGGRFLEYSKRFGTWTELRDRAVIRHKIATYFKELRRKMKVNSQVNMNESSTDDFEALDGQESSRKRTRHTCLPQKYISQC